MLAVLLDWITLFDWVELLEIDKLEAIDSLALAADSGLEYVLKLLEVINRLEVEVTLKPAKFVGADKLRVALDVDAAITGELKG